MKPVESLQLAGIFATLCILVTPGTAKAQNAPAPHSMKTIGTPSAAAKPEIVPSLFVLNSRGAMLQGDSLVLTGVTPNFHHLCGPPGACRRSSAHGGRDSGMELRGRQLCQEPAECDGIGARQGRFGQGRRGGAEESETGGRQVDLRRSNSRRRSLRGGWPSCLVHRHYRPTADAAIVCRGCPSFRIPRRNVCRRRRSGFLRSRSIRQRHTIARTHPLRVVTTPIRLVTDPCSISLTIVAEHLTETLNASIA